MGNPGKNSNLKCHETFMWQNQQYAKRKSNFIANVSGLEINSNIGSDDDNFH